ncbi:hypothetical protein HYV50_01180 [Candidatus Pacearchaeota archaeon]|nr:hypothetical protein [Candidatus Pacearchaeota archaeon]
MLIIKKILKIFKLPIAILLLHIFLVPLGIYEKYLWFDIPMHLLGGLSVAMSYLALLKLMQSKKRLQMPEQILFVFVVSLVALTGILWEFSEFILDILTTSIKAQQGLTDTMSDLFFNLIGGVFGYFLKNHKSL